MVVVLLLWAGVFRLGWIADLLSIPVTTGFLAGISVHIIISQLPGILGLPAPNGPMLQRLAILAGHLNETNFFTLAIGLAVLVIITKPEPIHARIPGALMALVLAGAALIVLVLLASGASLLGRIRNAALGGVLLFVALRIIRFGQIVTTYRRAWGEFLLIIATAAAIVLLPIEQGVGIGISLSLLHGIWSTTRARVVIFKRVPGTSIWWPASANLPGEREPGVIVAGFQAPLAFLNAYDFRRDILEALQSVPERARLLVLEATGIVEIDFTAGQIRCNLIRKCHADGVDFAIARLESIRAQEAMARLGINEVLGPDRQFRSVEEAIRALAKRKN